MLGRERRGEREAYVHRLRLLRTGDRLMKMGLPSAQDDSSFPIEPAVWYLCVILSYLIQRASLRAIADLL
jgi:hypothetical protein